MKTLLRFFLDERRVDHSDYDWYGEFCVNEIEDTAIISCKTAREISTTSLGELILDRLYKIDKVYDNGDLELRSTRLIGDIEEDE